MFSLLLLTAIIGAYTAGITDTNCTTGGKYDESANNCPDTLPSIDCVYLFGAAVEVGRDTERAEKCFQNADKKVDETMKQFAIRNCPKTCGYCCLTPAFNCDNKKHPRITCALVTKEMCTDPLWKPIIAEDCPKVCGFCMEGNCADKATSCSVALCKHIDLQDFVKQNCQKTCDLCEEGRSSTSSNAAAVTTASPADCGNDARCQKWKANGFCTNSHYTKEVIMRTCGRLCGLC